MFYYKGAKEMGYIQPRTLASYDIVITTYETLGTVSRCMFSYLVVLFHLLSDHLLLYLFSTFDKYLFGHRFLR
jgi:hypothetical protein